MRELPSQTQRMGEKHESAGAAFSLGCDAGGRDGKPPSLGAVTAELASIADAGEAWRPSTVGPRPPRRQVLPNNRPPRRAAVPSDSGQRETSALQ
jgi:hypothetical protein